MRALSACFSSRVFTGFLSALSAGISFFGVGTTAGRPSGQSGSTGHTSVPHLFRRALPFTFSSVALPASDLALPHSFLIPSISACTGDTGSFLQNFGIFMTPFLIP
jgi:hypothetical protein